jgi:hypothetical protein
MNYTINYKKSADEATQDERNEMRNSTNAQYHLLQAFKAVGVPVDANDEFEQLLSVIETRKDILNILNR